MQKLPLRKLICDNFITVRVTLTFHAFEPEFQMRRLLSKNSCANISGRLCVNMTVVTFSLGLPSKLLQMIDVTETSGTELFWKPFVEVTIRSHLDLRTHAIIYDYKCTKRTGQPTH